MKFCDTPTLIRLNDECIANPHCNRAIDEKAYELLDPDGTHLFDSSHIIFRMAGHGFVRPMVSMKFKDTMEPTQVPMDLSSEQWESLSTFTKEMDEMLKSGKECVECGYTRPHHPGDYLCLICRNNG